MRTMTAHCWCIWQRNSRSEWPLLVTIRFQRKDAISAYKDEIAPYYRDSIDAEFRRRIKDGTIRIGKCQVGEASMTLGDKIRALKAEWGCGGGAALDHAAALADEHAATIAAAYEAAAQKCEQARDRRNAQRQEDPSNREQSQRWIAGALQANYLAEDIRAMTDADAAAALARIKAEARREGMREAYELCKGVRRGAETDDYGIGALDCAIAILTASGEAGNG